MASQHYVGLTDAEVLESRRKNGSNILTPPEKDPWWKTFLGKFDDPLIVILLVAGVLSVGISAYEYFGLHHDWKIIFESIGLFVAVLLATGAGFIFELRSGKAFGILNQVNDDELVEVMRNGAMTTVPRKDIVVGDIVFINTGDEIPADGVLLDAVTLSVDESSLTGEPMCVKTTNASEFGTETAYPSNLVHRGCQVLEGHAVFKVCQVGDKTEGGKIMKSIGENAENADEEIEALEEKENLTKDEHKRLKLLKKNKIDKSVKTPLNEQLEELAKWITNASYVIAGLIIVGQLAYFFADEVFISWEMAISFIVFLIPTVPFVYKLITTKSFKGWAKARAFRYIAGFFLIFIVIVILTFDIKYRQAGNIVDWTVLLNHTLQTLMIAITLVVVAVPEGLPMAVTLSLAYIMKRMFHTNNLVRKMHACETMGAATVICTDKTGTLTQNRMQVYKTNIYGQPSNEILYESLAVNSTAQLSNTNGKIEVLGNPTEGALLLWLNEQGIDYVSLRENTSRIEELPFSTERKYMATVVHSATGKRILYVKGAPEIVFALCSNKSGATDTEVDKLLSEYQNHAMRTLGLAYQELADGDKTFSNGKILADKLTFLGIVAISDPVRSDVPAAIKEVLDAGIKIKIVTGDTLGTAKEIARQIGLWDDLHDGDQNIITGPEFALLSDKQLQERVKDLKIIARAKPMDKKRLVEALQANNEVVAVTGDGTNDAPALRAAHVGLSMGDGTAVAKEASDITIIDNSFSSIGRAVMWGRSLYKNIQRFLLFQLTVNVAACFLVLVGSFMGTTSPLSVTQMLWVNLIMDTFGAMALSSLPPTHKVMSEKPRDRKASILTHSMLCELFGVGFFFFALTLGFYWLFNHADVTSLTQIPHIAIGEHNGMTTYEATLLFSIFVWTHFWYMFNARCFETGKSIFKLPLSSGFKTIVAVIIIGQFFITEIAYEFFNVEPMLHTTDWRFNPTGAIDLLIIIVASSLVLWVREVYQLFKK
jgi:Ca2+-transporting ATPase